VRFDRRGARDRSGRLGGAQGPDRAAPRAGGAGAGAAMTPEPDASTIVVSLTEGASPISGSVSGASLREPRPFTGWLGLLSALETALERPGEAPERGPGQGEAPAH